MEYELINPSDPYTFIASSNEVAALTVFCLSTGYGAKAKDESFEVPIFMFGGDAKWYHEQFGQSPAYGVSKNRIEVANALESFMYGGFEDRKRYQAALKAIDDDKKREDFIAEWQDGRSSLNDIGNYAHALAKKLKDEINKSDLERAKNLIKDFCHNEYGSGMDADFDDLEHIPVAYTTTEDELHEIEVQVNLLDYSVSQFLDNACVEKRSYGSLRELIDAELSALDFDELVRLNESITENVKDEGSIN